MPDHQFDRDLAERLRTYESRLPEAEVPPVAAVQPRRPWPVVMATVMAAVVTGALLAIVLPPMSQTDIGEGSPTARPTSITRASVEQIALDTPRRDCSGAQEQLLAIFRIRDGGAFWTLFPEAGLAPELAEVDAPLIIVVYDGLWQGGTSGGIGASPRLEPAPGTADICVETADGSPAIASASYGVYPDIPLASSPLAAAIATEDPLPSLPASPTPSLFPSDGLGVAGRDMIWRVTVSDLIVRSEPGVADPDTILPARLTDEDRVLVVDGPRGADGYQWYQVLPLRPDGLREPPFGWVASASRDGEPWMAMEALTCPESSHLDGILALAPEERLACFGSRTIRFVAGEEGGCGAGGGFPVAYEPAWLAGFGGCGFGRNGADNWLMLRFPPDASQAYRPGDEIVGHFDDPAATTCVATANYPEVTPPSREEAIARCRTEFVVESVTSSP